MPREHIQFSIDLRRNWLAALIFRGPLASLTSKGLLVRTATSEEGTVLPYNSITEVSSSQGWFWDRVSVGQMGGQPSLLRGIHASQGPVVQAAIKAFKSSAELPETVMLRQALAHELYISAYDEERLAESHSRASKAVRELAASLSTADAVSEIWRAGFAALGFEDLYKKFTERPRASWNEAFVGAEVERIRLWARMRFPTPPTDEQLRAIVTAEDNQLVVAGAGTGKTTTVLGKIAYLVEIKKVAPERILAIAFNKDAAAEIRARLEKLAIPVVAAPGGKGVLASTYHALGGNLIHEVNNAVRKDVTVLEKDSEARQDFIRKQLLSSFRAKETHADVRDFLAYYSTPIGDARDYPSYEAYVQSESAANLRVLKDGKLVKSHGERLIANWLFLHGLDYKYEQQFAFPLGNPQNQRYQPDFAVATPLGPIYIEYYGVDAQGQTAPGIDRAGYLKTREWKRQLHKAHKTPCVELTYAQLKAGDLFSALSNQLQQLLSAPDKDGQTKPVRIEDVPIEEVEKLFVKDKDGPLLSG